VRIINTSDQPFEFQFDSRVYGPFQPGEIADLDDAIALHGLNRSKVIDEMGNTTGYRLEALNDMRGDTARLRSILSYHCPFGESGQCDTQPFKSVEELRAHMESHWAVNPKEPMKEDLFAEIAPIKATKK